MPKSPGKKSAPSPTPLSKQQEAEQALLPDDDRWLCALIGSDLGVWDWNIQTQEVFYSELWSTMLGYAKEEISNQFEEWTRRVHPEDLEPTLALIKEHLDGGTPFYTSEHRIRAKDGSYHWILDRGKVVSRDANGLPLRLVGTHTDITKHKEAECSLKESQQRFQEMADNIGEIFYNYDVIHNRLLYANRAYERIWGRSFESIQANPTSYLDAVHPQDRAAAEEAFHQQLAGEETHVEFRVIRPDGKLCWVHEHGVPVRDAQGQVERIVGTMRDITEKKLTHEKIRENEEKFRLLSKASHDAIWDWNLETNAIWWNDCFKMLFGYSSEELDGTIESWYIRIHPEEKETVTAGIHRAIDSGAKSWSAEYRFLCRDGNYAYVVDHGHIIHDTQGKAVRMIGGMTDQTERKRTEEQLREQATLLDKAQDAILVRDLAHRILYWNRSAERLYGWTSEEALGSSVKEILYSDLTLFESAAESTLTEGEWIGELQQVTKNGEFLTVESRWTLVRDSQGNPKSILSINTDITERKRLEQQFLRAQRMESIGTLAGGIAHDLNNVLAPIMMSIELLKMQETDSMRMSILSTIEASAKHGADMIKQVLSFARGVESQLVDVQPRVLLTEIEKIINETFLKSIQVSCHIPDDLWILQGDPTQLHQVLVNLCVNARDAMPHGGMLTLSASNQMLDENEAAINLEAKAGPYVVILVKDTGIGMSPKVVERIYDPFFTTKEMGKGTGLGLSTTLAIIKSHGGFIRVQSEVGRGTQFHVHLPAQPYARLEPSPSEDVELPHGQGELVLLVDDEAAVRRITQQTLEAFGYRVLLAPDGAVATALFAIQKKDISVVLTDMMMPVMDGPATIPLLKSMDPNVRIIASSGLNAQGMQAKAASVGVKHFIPKPYSAEVLLKTLRQALTE